MFCRSDNRRRSAKRRAWWRFRACAVGNKYFDSGEPWKTCTENETAYAEAIYNYIQLIANLAVLFKLFLPFSSAKIRGWLSVGGTWGIRSIPAGSRIPETKILFERIVKRCIHYQRAIYNKSAPRDRLCSFRSGFKIGFWLFHPYCANIFISILERQTPFLMVPKIKGRKVDMNRQAEKLKAIGWAFSFAWRFNRSMLIAWLFLVSTVSVCQP